jgi:hypothetical protein
MPLPLTKSKRKRQLCQDTKRDYKYRSGRTTAGEGPVEEINTTGTATVVLSSSPTLTGEPRSTAAAGTNTAQLATTAFVLSNSDRYYPLMSQPK